MATVAALQQEILRLKKERDICILAHSYQTPDIVEVADYVGDSFQLSRWACDLPHKTVVMCGVRFMAETVKLLSPEKRVILANPTAGCPMAEQMTPEMILEWKAQYPDRTVVAYINTTTAIKTVCDVCVTSASAVQIVRNLPGDKVLFIPDCQLGAYVAEQVPQKDIMLVQGGCPVHTLMTAADVQAARAVHPEALFLVHPECKPEVVALADYIGSTTGIMKYAAESDCREFIIGTELSIAEHLGYTHPDKRFYPLSSRLICADMKATTLQDVYHSLLGDGGEDITLDEATRTAARVPIDRMMAWG